MPSINIMDIMIKHFPERKELYESKQYQLSERVLELQMNMSYGQAGMATKLGLLLEDYLDYENGTLRYTVADYQKLILQMEQIQEKQNQLRE